MTLTAQVYLFRTSILLLLFSTRCPEFARTEVIVGHNVQVSKDRPALQHGEDIVGIDLSNSDHIIACSMTYFPDKAVSGVIAYVSFDRGKTWEHSFDFDAEFAGDPDCGYLNDGSAYLVLLTEGGALFYRSQDAGKSWLAPTSLKYRHIDREFVAVDRSGDKPCIYLTAQIPLFSLSQGLRTSAMALWRSFDGGATFRGPTLRLSDATGGFFNPGPPAVLSNGMVISSSIEILSGNPSRFEALPLDRTRPNAKLWAITSGDGGETFQGVSLVSGVFKKIHGFVPSIAVDGSSSPFRDRIYLVWQDARSGRYEILSSFSADKGKTWSRPRRVNDDLAFPDSKSGPNDYLPAIAANHNGVVGVIWHDRRDNVDDLGSWLRFSASLDGGETFLPSVRVADAPNSASSQQYWPIQVRTPDYGFGDSHVNEDGTHRFKLIKGAWDYYVAGHTNGLAVDAEGVFHPVWMDDRTGVDQLWTAPVTVNGIVAKNGAANLAALDDVSSLVTIEFSVPAYNRVTSTASLRVRLRNISTKMLKGELYLRIVGLDSEFGTASVLGSVNHVQTAGAVLNLSQSLRNGTLKPGNVSEWATISVHLTAMRPITVEPDGRVKTSLVIIDARILGSAE